MRRSRPYIALLLLTAVVFGVASCGSEDPDSSSGAAASTTVDQPAEDTAGTTVVTTQAPSDTTTSVDPATEAATPTNAAPTVPAEDSPLAPYEEFSVLQRTIGDLDSLTPVVETDNPNTRVILFENAEGRAVYKSVLVKRGSRLKVLDLSGGPPLYDAPI